MGTPLHGKDGYVYVGGSAVALVDRWTMNVDVAQDDVTSMDSGGWQQLLAGVKRVSGAVTVRYATDDTNGQTVLRNSAIGGSMVVLKLNPNGTANYFSGTALLNLGFESPHDNVNVATYDFNSHGPWTYTGT